MKRILICFFSLAYWIFIYFWRWTNKIIGRNLSCRCVVLYYHAINQNDRNKFAWQMENLVKRATPISVSNKNPLGKELHYVGITFDDGYQSIIENALPELMRQKIPATIFIQTGYFGRSPEWIRDANHPLRREIVMSADQLMSINGDLISVGSHCVSHNNLLGMYEKECKKELIESKSVLESLLGQKIDLLSFPHGVYNEQIIKWSQEIGYKRVFTILPTYAFRNAKEYVTGRVKVEPTDWKIEFILKLFGAYCWLPLASKLKAKLYVIHKRPSHQGRM